MPSYSGIFTLQAQMQAIAANLWTAAPGVPTSVVATGGSASASVTFTAPAFTGGPAGVTAYTVTSSPGGLTGTGASSPISVTGLTNGTAYTFTVTATGASGISAPSASSNSVTPLVPIGSAFGGGFFAGQISTTGNGVADYNLVVGPVASAQNSALRWKVASTSTPGTSSVIDGPANSAVMNNADHPAAQFCEAVTTGGFSDWYMPALNELEVCYYNLKPTTATNLTSVGSNANAVPARGSNYTSGTPAQTSATDFRSTGAEDFVAASYWASTNFSAPNAWIKVFGNGNQYGYAKGNGIRVRAIRRVAV
tara:strand:+ start:1497 stop:2423 length:927 start_codon:yes stop_codon:yes gene_type:complete